MKQKVKKERERKQTNKTNVAKTAFCTSSSNRRSCFSIIASRLKVLLVAFPRLTRTYTKRLCRTPETWSEFLGGRNVVKFQSSGNEANCKKFFPLSNTSHISSHVLSDWTQHMTQHVLPILSSNVAHFLSYLPKGRFMSFGRASPRQQH